MNAPVGKHNSWPCAIIVHFIVFASALIAWITYAVQQNMDLVRLDYYEEEIRYQQQLDRLNRTQNLHGKVSVAYDPTQQAIVLTLPAAHARQQLSGRIQFYRPSDASLDYTEPLTVKADGTQRLDPRNLRPGLWKIRVQWTAAGQDYFFDQPIVVGGL
jgi:hypothetical protein